MEDPVAVCGLFTGTPSKGLHQADNADWSWDHRASIWIDLQCAGGVLPVQGLSC